MFSFGFHTLASVQLVLEICQRNPGGGEYSEVNESAGYRCITDEVAFHQLPSSSSSRSSCRRRSVCRYTYAPTSRPSLPPAS